MQPDQQQDNQQDNQQDEHKDNQQQQQQHVAVMTSSNTDSSSQLLTSTADDVTESRDDDVIADRQFAAELGFEVGILYTRHSRYLLFRRAFTVHLKLNYLFYQTFPLYSDVPSGLPPRTVNHTGFLCLLIFSERELTMLSPVRLSSVCLSVVCNVRAPYSGSSNFRQYFYGIRYLGHPLTSTEN